MTDAIERIIRAEPPLLETIIRAAVPEARPVIRRLADLEARDALTPAEMHELNTLRIQLERWPAVNGALARAYVSMHA